MGVPPAKSNVRKKSYVINGIDASIKGVTVSNKVGVAVTVIVVITVGTAAAATCHHSGDADILNQKEIPLPSTTQNGNASLFCQSCTFSRKVLDLTKRITSPGCGKAVVLPHIFIETKPF
jgi:hypothetical protein